MIAVLVLLVGGAAAYLRWRDARHGAGGPAHRAAHEAHPHDPSMRREHAALLELLPEDACATHVAARDGAWDDPATWEAGSVPGEGAIVRVPAGRSVRCEGAHPAHLFLVRVDGTLTLTAGAGGRTSLVVDTLFTTPESRLELATTGDGLLDLELRPFDIEAYEARADCAWSPAARELYEDGRPVVDTCAATVPSAEAREVFDGPGVLGRYGWDPEQLSLGLVVHGAARLAGRPVQGRAVLAAAPRAGDTILELDAEPAGWLPGDRIVVVGTHFVGRDLVTGAFVGSEDELRTVRAVRGRSVELDRPLVHDHDAPRADLSTYVVHLTRSIRVHGHVEEDLEHPDADAIGALASSLGHVMFMHHDDVQVRHAAFASLGRTNKNDVADDFRRNGFDSLDAGRQWQRDEATGAQRPIRTKVHQVTNPRGRYALHLHRTGARADDSVGRVEGSVVTGGPSWGFVSHDSRADFVDNVAFGVLGAGFVAETGNETGTWSGNTAVRTYGAAFNSGTFDPTGLYQFENDDFERTVLLEKRGSWKNHDFSHFGNGFWLQGKLIDMRGNVAANSGLSGYFYMFRAPDQINVDPALLREPLSVHSPAGIHPLAPGLNVFEGNESIADRCGLAMIGTGGGRTNDERSILREFRAWEVGQMGTHAQYYPGYTIRDSLFLASTSPTAHPTQGVYFEKVQVDTVLAHLTVEGFHLAYDLRKSWSPGARTQQGFEDPYEVVRRAAAEGRPNPLPLGYAHVLIEPGFTREEARQPHLMDSTYRPEDLILRADELVPGRLEVQLDDDSLRVDLDNRAITYGTLPDDPVRPTLQEGHVLLLRGTKIDSIGPIPLAYHNNVLVWHEDAVQHRLETEGYYRMPSGDLGVRLEEMVSDRYTGEKKVVRFFAWLDPRWDLTRAVDRGPYDEREHAGIHVPAFLLGS